MEAPPTSHPTDESLSAYGLGKLDDRSAEAIGQHLERCDDCRRRASEVSSDSFLGRFRAAQKPSGGTAFAGSIADGMPSLIGAKGPTPPPSADTLPPGLADHPDYQIRRELGRGGMGVVYLAHNTMMGRDEVLKVMGRHIMERPGVLERFQREIKAVAKLRHPNIVVAHSAFRLDGGLVFAMEYVEGLDLARLVKAKGPLPVPHAAYFIHQAALGLQHAHERGMVHRDIKPHNLMLTHDGKARVIKVLDFGLAKATREEKVDGGLTSEGQALGTPDYIAPEQIVNAPDVDTRADIYSLGGTLFYLLTGRPPFVANSLYDMYQAHMSREIEPLNLLRPEVPAELAALVSKMMAKDSKRRFQTPAEVARALTPFFKKAAVAPKSPASDLSEAGSMLVGRPDRSADSSPTQLMTDIAEPILRSIESPTQPSIDRGAMIEIAGLSLDAPSPMLSTRGSGKSPPRNRKIIAAASAAILAVLCGIIIIIQWDRDKRSLTATVTNDPARAAKVIGADAATPQKVGRDDQARTDDAPVPPPARFDLSAYEIFDVGTMWKDKFEKDALGRWYTEGNELVMKFGVWDTINPPRATVLFGDPAWTDYDFTFKVKSESIKGGEARSFIMVFRSRARQSQYEFMATSGDRSPQKLVALDFQHEKGEELGQAGDLERTRRRIMLDEWYTMRAEVRGDRIRCFLGNAAEEALVFDVKDARHPSGRVGLKTIWGLHRFKDIKVTAPDGRVLWEGLPKVPSLDSAAPKGPEKVAEAAKPLVDPAVPNQGAKGKWAMDGGDLIQTSTEGISALAFGDPSWRDYDLKVRARSEGGRGDCWLFHHHKDGRNHKNFYINEWGASGLGTVVDGSVRREPARCRIARNRWYDVEIKVRGPSATFFLDGKKVLDHSDARMDHGQITLAGLSTAYRIRQITVTAPDGKVLFSGLPRLPSPMAGMNPRPSDTGEVVDASAGARGKPAAGVEARSDDVLSAFAPGLGLSSRDIARQDEKFRPVVGEYRGRPRVLQTHPVGQTVPFVMDAEVAVPAGKTTRLVLDVSHDKDWNLQVKAEGRTLHDSIIGPDTTVDHWKTIAVDLSEFAGRKVHLELINKANDWNDEYGIWGRIDVVSEAKPAIVEDRPGTVDLLKLVDLNRDRVRGNWKREGGDLVLATGPVERVRLPYVPPIEYDYLIEFTLDGGDSHVFQDCAVDGVSFAWEMGLAGHSACGFQHIGGKGALDPNNPTKTHRPDFPKPGQRHQSVVKVRRGGISAWIDGKKVAEHATDFTDLAINDQEAVGPNSLGLGAAGAVGATVRFHRVEVWEARGRGKVCGELPRAANPEPIAANLPRRSLLTLEPVAHQGRPTFNAIAGDFQVAILGKPCDQYIYSHAPGSLVYPIPKQAVAFRAVGTRPVDSQGREAPGAWRFKVYVDGDLAFTGPSLYEKGNTEIEVRIPEGGRFLEIRTESFGGNNGCHAVWAYPHFVMPGR